MTRSLWLVAAIAFISISVTSPAPGNGRSLLFALLGSLCAYRAIRPKDIR